MGSRSGFCNDRRCSGLKRFVKVGDRPSKAAIASSPFNPSINGVADSGYELRVVWIAG